MKKKKLLMFTIAMGLLIGVTALKATTIDATISGIEAELISDGTLPFDSDDSQSKDSSPTNQIIRSYDEATYDFSVGINGTDSNKRYDVEVTAELPDINTEERLQLQWLSSNFSSDDVKVEKRGTLLTFYIRNLRPGQLYTKSLVLETKALDNGFILKPKFTAKIVGDSRVVECEANKEVRVTAQTNLDVDLKYSGTMSLQEIEGTLGRVVPFGIDIKSKGDSSSKGRGNSFPTGDIEMILNISTTKVDIATKVESPVELDTSPLGVLAVGTTDKFGNQIRISSGIGSGPTSNNPTNVANGGKMTLEEIAPNKYRLLIKDYKITNHFPRLHWGSGNGNNPNSRDWTESYRYFISHAFEIFIPLIKDNDIAYDIRAKLDIEKINFVDAEGNHDMDIYTPNNTRTVVVPDYVDGSYSINNYTQSKDNVALDRPFWTGQNARILRNGGEGRLQPYVTFGGHNSPLEGMQGGIQMLTLFQGDKIKLTGPIEHYLSNANHNPVKNYKIWYGVGKLTKEEVVNNNTTASALTWYESLDEARKAERPEEGIYISGTASDCTDNIWATGGPQIYQILRFQIRTGNTVPFEAIASKGRAKVFQDKERTKFTNINPSYKPAEYDINGDIVSGTQVPSSSSGGASFQVIPYEANVSANSMTTEGKHQTSFDLKRGNTVQWEISASLNSGQTEVVEDKIQIIHRIPVGESYNEGSASIEPVSITVLESGETEIVWEFDGYNPDIGLPKITFQNTIPLITEDRKQFQHTTIVRADGDRRIEKEFRTDLDTITVITDASMQITKSVNKPLLELDEEFEYTLTYGNGSDKDYHNGVFLDILPFNTDSRGSDYNGKYIIKNLKLPPGVTAYMTNQDASTISSNPLNDNVSNWEPYRNGEEITALKFEVGDILRRTEKEINVTVKPNGNKKEDTYLNSYTAFIEGLDISLSSNTVQTKVIARELEGKVWYDGDENGVINDAEEIIENIEVKLLDSRDKLIKTTRTNNDGDYRFEELPTGTYKVEFEVPNGTNPTRLGSSDKTNENHSKVTEGKLISQEIVLEKEMEFAGKRNLGVKPNIIVDKELNESSISPGSVASWTLAVTNDSKVNGTVESVELVDDIPVGVEVLENSITEGGVYDSQKRRITWNFNNLKSSERREASFSAKVTGKNPNDLRNIALVLPYEKNPKPVPSEPVEMPIVEAIKSSNPEPNTVLENEQEITYNIKVDNIGNAVALNTVVEDTIPEYTELVAGSITENGTIIGNKITWNIPSIKEGDSKVLAFKVKVKMPTNLYKATITNTASVNGTPTNTIEHEVKLPHLIFNKDTATLVEIPLEEGNQIVYSINVENIGEAPSKEILIEDVIPQGTTLVNSNGAVLENNKLKWTLPPLDAKAKTSIEFTVSINDLPTNTFSSIINNVAKVNEKDTNEITHNVIKSDLKYSKSSNVPNNSLVAEGSNIGYKLVLENKGTADARNIKVVDNIPTGITVDESSISDSGKYSKKNNTITWNITKVSPNETKELTFNSRVDKLNEGVFETSIINTATVNDNDTNNTTHLVKKPNIISVKDITNITPGQVVLEGDRIDYRIKVQNNGTLKKDNVIVKDTIPQGTSYIKDSGGVLESNEVKWEIPTILPGEEVSLTFSVTINNLPNEDITGLVSNTAIVDGKDTNTVTTPVDTFRQQTIKLVSNDVAVIGDKLKYNIEVQNTGSLPLENVVVTDVVPEHTKIVLDSISEGGTYDNKTNTITWNIDSIAKDAKEIVSFDVVVLESAKNLVITNIANVNGHPTNEVETEVVERGISGTVWLDLNKDGRMQEDELGIKYVKVELVNSSNDCIKTALTDDLGRYQFSGLQPGEYKSKFELPSGTDVTTKHLIETERSNHTDESLVSSSRTLGKIQLKEPILNLGVIPVLEITKEVDKDHVQVGEEFTYTLNVTNSATQGEPLTDILVEDNLPKGITYKEGNKIDWVIPSIKNGETVTKSFQVVLEDKEVNHIANTATIKSYGKVLELTQSNTVNTVVLVTKKTSSIKGDYLQPGDLITYNIIVTNKGNTTATNIEVEDNIPTELELIKGSIENINKLKSGESKSIEITCKVKDNVLQGDIKNTASIDNINTNTVTDPVKLPNIIYSKSSSTPVNVSEDDIIDYKITVENNGEGKSGLIVVEDIIPEGLELIEESISVNGAKKGNSVIWKLDSLEPGSSRYLTFRVKVLELPKDVYTMKYTNIALVDDKPTNEVEHISTKGNLVYHKESNTPYEQVLSPGDLINYKIVLENTGKAPLTDIVVQDAIPTETEFSTSNGVEENGVVTWNVPVIEHGERVELILEVKALKPKEGFSSEITNVATVNNEETNKVVNQVKIPNIEQEKSSDNSNAILISGDHIPYKITVRNTGDTYKDNIVVKDIIPEYTTLVEIPKGATLNGNELTWNIERLESKSEIVLEFKVTVNEGVTEKEIINIATVDDVKTNEVKHYVGTHKYEFNKFTTTEEAEVDGKIEYGIEVINTGTVVLKDINIIDSIPKFTELLEIGQEGKLAGEAITWNIEKLEPEERLVVSFTVKPLESSRGENIVNVAQVNSKDTNEVIHYIPPLEVKPPKEEQVKPPKEEEVKPPKEGQEVKPPVKVEPPIYRPSLNLPQTGTNPTAIRVVCIFSIITGIAVYILKR